MKERGVHQSRAWLLNSGTIVVLITGGLRGCPTNPRLLIPGFYTSGASNTSIMYSGYGAPAYLHNVFSLAGYGAPASNPLIELQGWSSRSAWSI